MADGGVYDETGAPGPSSSSSARRRRSSEVAEAAVSMSTSCSDHPRGVDPAAVCRPPSARRKFRTLTFGRHYKSNAINGPGQGGTEGAGLAGENTGAKDGGASSSSKKKRKNPWTFRFNYRLRRDTTTDIPDQTDPSSVTCICTGYRRTEEHHLGAGLVFQASSTSSGASEGGGGGPEVQSDGNRPTGIISRPTVSTEVRRWYDEYPIEDWEERARAERARELEEGVDPPPGYRPSSVSPLLSTRRTMQQPLGPLGTHLLGSTFELRLSDLAIALQSRLTVQRRNIPVAAVAASSASSPTALVEPAMALFDNVSGAPYRRRPAHTQVDYIHCLVPDLLDITRCVFYWGKMDRYEAESLLDGRPEGTFLLRDSAQDEYLFSVSFRRYGRSLHARVEQWSHRFSFDSHDPGVYSSTTVCGLVEHYKDPTCCMFFEPMLTLPLHRTFPFPLQHLCRAAIVGSRLTYDGINELRLPKPLKAYLKEYHYKQRVRVRILEQQ